MIVEVDGRVELVACRRGRPSRGRGRRRGMLERLVAGVGACVRWQRWLVGLLDGRHALLQYLVAYRGETRKGTAGEEEGD